MANNILTKIIANKRRELTIRKNLMSIEYLKSKVNASKRSLYRALSNEKSDFIFECKKASPSKGMIRQSYDLEHILSSYKRYASAISVLTDYKYFKGSFAHLTQVSQSVDQPVLCKDFFIDIYQVYEARYFGADAILLMLSVLNNSQYKQLVSIASSLNLDVLTEVHDETEMQRAIALGAKIIGINNRNLKDLSIDLATTEKLIAQLPPDLHKEILFISESGINNHQQVKKLAPLVNGFLIGSSIMEKTNITQQCKSLIYGVVKICGLTNEKTAVIAYEQGAIYGGLIFHPQSPRFVELSKAIKITEAAKLDYVGVFVNEAKQKLIEIALELNLKVIQLHGKEDERYIQAIKKALPECAIWKAVSVKGKLTENQESLSNKSVDRYLFDTYSSKQPGGSGQTFDWELLKNIPTENIILAGGIDISNIECARQLNTFGLDINSGVETSPGIKCDKKIAEIFDALHA